MCQVGDKVHIQWRQRETLVFRDTSAGREIAVLVGCLRDARVKSRDNTTVFNHSRLQV